MTGLKQESEWQTVFLSLFKALSITEKLHSQKNQEILSNYV